MIMIPYKVVCITKLKTESTNEHITYIGYYESVLKPKVIIPIDEAIRRIEANKWAFYLAFNERIMYLEIYNRSGIKYIRSMPDSNQKDWLLNLSQC